jgi:hypothetical protein
MCLGFTMMGCAEQPSTQLSEVEELQRYFEQEGFTFTLTPTTDVATRWGQLVRLGRIEDESVLVAIYGDDTPTRVTMRVRGHPLEDRAEVHTPHMVRLLQTMVPEWGDANTWLSTQMGLSQNQEEHHIVEHRGNVTVEFNGTPNVLDLSMTLQAE